MEDSEEIKGRIYDGRLFRRLVKYVRPYRLMAMAGMALVMAASLLVIAGPMVIRFLTDEGIGKNNYDLIVTLALVFLGLEWVRFVVEYFQGYLLQKLGQVSMRDLRMDLFRHLQRLPMSFYEEYRVGRIVTRTTNDVAALNELFSAGLITLFKDVILIGGVGTTLLIMNFQFGLVTLAVAPFLAVAALGFRKFLRGAYRRVRAAVSKLNATMQENIGGAKVIQLFGVEQDRYGRFKRDSDEFMEAALSSVRTHAFFNPIIAVTSSLALGMVFWYGGGQAIQGSISLGVLVAFIQYMPHLLTPIRDMGEKFTILQSAFAAAERVFGVLDTPVGIVDRPGLAPLASARGEVAVEGVKFGYKRETEILHGVSLSIRQGERVALVGKTGSGKTTLSRLMARFYDPWEGAVRLDGRDLRDVPLDDLRAAVAVVSQDVFIFPGSVIDNVRLGDESISREQVIEACRWTNAHTFIERLPNGYDHALAEGGRNLSMGERQLLSFARALARRPAVLILDEATASVDTRTERLITEAVDRITRGRTSIIIAHRLATVKNADRVIVIEDGRIVEDGPPGKLLETGGIFQRMHSLQFAK